MQPTNTLLPLPFESWNPRNQDHEVSKGFSSHVPKEHSVTAVDATCGRSGKSHCATIHSTLISLLSHPLTQHPATHPFSEPTSSLGPQAAQLFKSQQVQGWGCGLGVEHLLSMYIVLCSVSKLAKQTKNKQANKSEMETYSFTHSISAA